MGIGMMSLLVVGDKYGRYVDETESFFKSFIGSTRLVCFHHILKEYHDIDRETLVTDYIDDLNYDSVDSIIKYLESQNGDGCDFLQIFDISNPYNVTKLI